MPFVAEINKAIAAHGQWKQRLSDAIANGTSDFQVDNVRKDNLCDFGKWLYGLPPVERSDEHWISIQKLHAEFHESAARVLNLALTEDSEAAVAEMGREGRYGAVSSELTIAMVKWKQTLREA